jgi:hypothetical protein
MFGENGLRRDLRDGRQLLPHRDTQRCSRMRWASAAWVVSSTGRTPFSAMSA